MKLCATTRRVSHKYKNKDNITLGYSTKTGDSLASDAFRHVIIKSTTFATYIMYAYANGKLKHAGFILLSPDTENMHGRRSKNKNVPYFMSYFYYKLPHYFGLQVILS
jgi:hypothetical protein